MISLRAFAESKAFCGLELSPLVGAILDVAEGVTPAIDDATAVAHFGCAVGALPSEPRRIRCVRAGRRGGKTSRILAPAALHAAWTTPLPSLAATEVAYVAVVCPDLKTAKQALSFVKGLVDSSPILSKAKTDETAEFVELRRPHDRARVRVEVMAASRRAGRSRTLAGACVDEGCFFDTGDEAAVSDTEIVRALLPALVDGAALWCVSSPWIEGFGYIESVFARDFGRHVNALAVQAPTRALNPNWDPTGEIEREMRASDPLAAARELDAVPLGGGAEMLFDAQALAQCVDASRPLSLPPRPFGGVTCAVDLGFTKDGAALAVVFNGDPIEVAHMELLLPGRGAPLQFGRVVATFAELIKRYGGTRVIADSFNRAAAIEEFARQGIVLLAGPEGATGKATTHLAVRRLISEGRVRLPNDPRLLAEMRAIVSRPTAGGGLQITTKRRAGGGHGDAASALVLALHAAERTHRANSGVSVFSRHTVSLPARGGTTSGMTRAQQLDDWGPARAAFEMNRAGR